MPCTTHRIWKKIQKNKIVVLYVEDHPIGSSKQKKTNWKPQIVWVFKKIEP